MWPFFPLGPPFFVPDEQVQSLFGECFGGNPGLYVFLYNSMSCTVLHIAHPSCQQALTVEINVHFFFSGNRCNIELLHSVDALTDRQRDWGLDYFTENVHLITLKSS